MTVKEKIENPTSTPSTPICSGPVRWIISK